MQRQRPIVRFTVSPSTPSTSSAVQLLDCSTDPEDVGVAWRAWDFGDGTTAVGFAPVHRYDAPGRYELTLTLATFDGRVGHESRVLEVEAVADRDAVT